MEYVEKGEPQEIRYVRYVRYVRDEERSYLCFVDTIQNCYKFESYLCESSRKELCNFRQVEALETFRLFVDE